MLVQRRYSYHGFTRRNWRIVEGTFSTFPQRQRSPASARALQIDRFGLAYVEMNDPVAQARHELVRLSRDLRLVFPIDSKEDFVSQMVGSSDHVLFHGIPYDVEFAANLIPEFFFPVASEEDLVSKTIELMMARGMLPLAPLESVDPSRPQD